MNFALFRYIIHTFKLLTTLNLNTGEGIHPFTRVLLWFAFAIPYTFEKPADALCRRMQETHNALENLQQ